MLATHVGAALLGLLAGGAGLACRKGGPSHRRAGRTFVIAMPVAAICAAALAVAAAKWLDVCSAALVSYLVLTAWTTLHPAPRWVHRSLSALAALTLCGYLAVELWAMYSGTRRPDVPPGAGFAFAAVIGLALLGDLRWRRGQMPGRRARLTRHLWRMCFALFLATASFAAVLGRADPLPQSIEGPVLGTLALTPLVLLAYFLVRTLTGPSAAAPDRTR